jgi:iron complex transport system substrate-binding protein
MNKLRVKVLGIIQLISILFSNKQNGMNLKILFAFCIVWLGFFVKAQNIQRIVSLAPSITETLYFLNAEEKLVGCTNYCTLAVHDGIQQIGSTVDVNVEKILALQPDLVLTMLMTKQQDIETMKKLGIQVLVFPSPVSFGEICEQTRQIAKLIGVGKNADSLIQQIENSVDSLRKVAESKLHQQKFFFQIGADPIFTVLENTFMNDLITFSNGENIANGLKRGTLTRESVVVKNPEVIIIATMGGFGETEMNAWMKYKELNAVKNNTIFLVDSETSCSPTPANFLKAFSDIVNYLSH